MLSSLFRKYAVRTQMRQFSTALICSRNQIRRRTKYCWSDSKCTNSVNVNHNVSVFRSYNSATNRNIYLQPLMDAPLCYQPPILSVFRTLITALIIQFKIDPEFFLDEYIKGSLHAAIVISNALATQNYEALEELVEHETLEIVKRNVDSLGSSQRELIAINKENNVSLLAPTNISIQLNSKADDKEYVVEISQVMYYFHGTNPLENAINSWSMLNKHFESTIIANYTFQRRYRNNTGDSWIAKVVNHFTPNFERATNS